MRLFVLALVALAAIVPARGQDQWTWPEKPKNLQVLPKEFTGARLRPIMTGFTRALGVRCTYCHVGEEGMPLERFDFASDEKRTKLVARQMMRMVQEINRRLDTIPGRTSAGLQVACVTCHRGVSRPLPSTTTTSAGPRPSQAS